MQKETEPQPSAMAAMKADGKGKVSPPKHLIWVCIVYIKGCTVQEGL